MVSIETRVTMRVSVDVHVSMPSTTDSPVPAGPALRECLENRSLYPASASSTRGLSGSWAAALHSVRVSYLQHCVRLTLSSSSPMGHLLFLLRPQLLSDSCRHQEGCSRDHDLEKPTDALALGPPCLAYRACLLWVGRLVAHVLWRIQGATHCITVSAESISVLRTCLAEHTSIASPWAEEHCAALALASRALLAAQLTSSGHDRPRGWRSGPAWLLHPERKPGR